MAACNVAQGTRLLLTQEVRNPRAGKYVLTVFACGGAATPAAYRELFLKHFTCRLSVFGYQDEAKDPLRPRVFAAADFVPAYAGAKEGDYEKVELAVVLKSQDDGAFHLSRGVGVAIVVEKTTPGVLNVPAGVAAFLRVDDVSLRFVPRPRNDEVQV